MTLNRKFKNVHINRTTKMFDNCGETLTIKKISWDKIYQQILEIEKQL